MLYLQQSQDLALVAGADLVAACRLIPLPDAAAGLTALMASGLSTERFAFEGFLPPKAKPRQERLQSLLTDPRTPIEGFGTERRVVTTRELTKLHQ